MGTTTGTGATTAEEAATPEVTTADGSEQSVQSVGVGLPRAAAWLDYWQNAEIPKHNTFVDFATSLDESGFFPRSNSMPDIALASSGRESDDGLSSTASSIPVREILSL